MNTPQSLATAFAGFALLVAGCVREKAESFGTSTSPERITGKSFRAERAYLVIVHVPNTNVDEVLAATITAVGLD